MATGIYVNYAQPAYGQAPVVSFPPDTPTAVELRVLTTLTQNLMGNGTQQEDELRVLRSDQISPGN